MAKTKQESASVDTKEFKKAEELWDVFTRMTKWSIIGIAALLLLMAATLL